MERTAYERKEKKTNQSVSSSSQAHQINTIIKKPSQQPSQNSSQKQDSSDDEYMEEEYTSSYEEWHQNSNGESTDEIDMGHK